MSDAFGHQQQALGDLGDAELRRLYQRCAELTLRPYDELEGWLVLAIILECAARWVHRVHSY